MASNHQHQNPERLTDREKADKILKDYNENAQFFRCLWPKGEGRCDAHLRMSYMPAHLAGHINFVRIKCPVCGAGFLDKIRFDEHRQGRCKGTNSDAAIHFPYDKHMEVLYWKVTNVFIGPLNPQLAQAARDKLKKRNTDKSSVSNCTPMYNEEDDIPLSQSHPSNSTTTSHGHSTAPLFGLEHMFIPPTAAPQQPEPIRNDPHLNYVPPPTLPSAENRAPGAPSNPYLPNFFDRSSAQAPSDQAPPAPPQQTFGFFNNSGSHQKFFSDNVGDVQFDASRAPPTKQNESMTRSAQPLGAQNFFDRSSAQAPSGRAPPAPAPQRYTHDGNRTPTGGAHNSRMNSSQPLPPVFPQQRTQQHNELPTADRHDGRSRSIHRNTNSVAPAGPPGTVSLRVEKPTRRRNTSVSYNRNTSPMRVADSDELEQAEQATRSSNSQHRGTAKAVTMKTSRNAMMLGPPVSTPHGVSSRIESNMKKDAEKRRQELLAKMKAQNQNEPSTSSSSYGASLGPSTSSSSRTTPPRDPRNPRDPRDSRDSRDPRDSRDRRNRSRSRSPHTRHPSSSSSSHRERRYSRHSGEDRYQQRHGKGRDGKHYGGH